jgi:hypothetical protein
MVDQNLPREINEVMSTPNQDKGNPVELTVALNHVQYHLGVTFHDELLKSFFLAIINSSYMPHIST